MPRYIDTNLFKAVVLACDHPELYDDFSERIFSVDDVLKMIDAVKTADVEKIEYSVWIKPHINQSKSYLRVCKVCGGKAYAIKEELSRCPHCGRHMTNANTELIDFGEEKDNAELH